VKILFSILFKTIVRTYYQENVGFFLIVIGFFLGFLTEREHFVFANLFLHSPLFLSFPFALWLLYHFKTINFVFKSLQLPQNEFLNHLRLYKKRQLFFAFCMLHVLLLFPIVIYLIYLTVIALQIQVIAPLFFIFVYLLCLVLAGALPYMRKINHFEQGKISKSIKITFPRPHFSFYIYYILRKHFLTFIVSKFFSFACIIFFSVVYKSDTYDERLIHLCVLFMASANLVLVYFLHLFEHQDCLSFKNLPIPLFKRFLTMMLVYAIVILPEVVFLYKNLHQEFSIFLFLLWFMSIQSWLLLAHQSLLIRKNTLVIFIRQCFFFILLLAVILFAKVSIFALSLLTLCIAFFIQHYRFYKYA
jgi:hypothetical protein